MRAVKLTAEGHTSLDTLSDLAPLASIRLNLGYGEWLHPEELTHAMLMWTSPDAALSPQPTLNLPAMWLIQQLRGVFGLPVIWGDVLVTGRDLRDLPLDLDPVRLELVRNTLTAEVQ